MGKAPDNIKKIALYASKAIDISTITPSFYARWIGNATYENQVIDFWKQKGINFAYLSNSNYDSGFTSVTYSSILKTQLRSFIQKCTNNGIGIGMVIGISTTTLAPSQRVFDYNQGSTTGQKIKAVFIEEEYWNGSMTFANYKTCVQSVRTLLSASGVSIDAYLVRGNVGDLAALVPYVDVFWLTQYTAEPRYDGIHAWVQEIANTHPSTPIKAGALISTESYYYNKTGGTSASNNFDGYWLEGRKPYAPFLPTQPIVTSPKNLNQLADKITHNGTVGLPPIDFNSEPSTVTNYIDWQGITVFDWDIYPHLSTVDANSNQVWLIGDGAVADAGNYPVAKQIASLVPYNAARLIYLGDVYDTGTQAEFINTPRSYDTIYGTQSGHNLNIITSATIGNHEWANRSVGYDKYWNGLFAGTGTVQPVWDGDRTITNPHYYSFFIGNWKFICLNSMEDGIASGGVTLGSTMYNWFINELNDPAGDKRKIVFCHHPRWSDDTMHGDNSSMQSIWAAMQGKALLLIGGHSHNYQRHNMRDVNGNSVVGGGVYQIVSGAGGQSVYPFTGSYASGMVAYKTLTHGASKFTLYDDHIDICFIDFTGTSLDCATIPVNSIIPPTVNAGVDQTITFPSIANLSGTATDSNIPSLSLVNIWTKISGAGTVTFADPNALITTATFSSAGTYVLRLTSNNGINSSYDEMTVTVSALASNVILNFNANQPNIDITLSIADVYGNNGGTAPFTRTYLVTDNPIVNLIATILPNGYSFQRWLRDGIPYCYSPSFTISDTINHTYTVEYGSPSPSTIYDVVFNSNISSSLSGNYTLISPLDLNNRPTSNPAICPNQFIYYGGTVLTFTGNGGNPSYPFLYWLKDGNPFVNNDLLSQTFTITADTVFTAVYDTTISNTFGIDITVSNALCPAGNGTLTITPIDTGTYTYLWNTGETTDTITKTTTGFYTCIITETTALYTVSSYSISQLLVVPQNFNATFDVVTTCGGTTADIQVNVTGGTAPYTYLWSTTETTRSITAVYGTYTVVITDDHGCVSGSFSVTTGSPTALAKTETVTDVSCNDGSNGSISILVSGGVYPYTYLWTKSGSPLNIYPNSSTADNLDAGTYDLTVVDANGCTITDTYVIAEPTALSCSLATTDITCYLSTDGTITFTSISGGTSPYVVTVLGSDGSIYTGLSITGLSQGDYSYLITDSLSCSLSGAFTIGGATVIEATVIKTEVTCNGGADGSATVLATGGTGTYTYSFDGGGFSGANTKSSLDSSLHNVVVKDSNGCTQLFEFFITSPASITLINVNTDPSSLGGSDGSIQLSVSGGVFPIVVTWQDGTIFTLLSDGVILYDSLSSGNYTATAVDSNSCSRVGHYSLVDPTGVEPYIILPDTNLNSYLILANCCLADKIYTVMKAYENGHTNIDCVSIPVLLLNEKIQLLRKWHTLGQTLGGSRGVFVFYPPMFNNTTTTITCIGFPDLVYISDDTKSQGENIILFIAALVSAGYDAEYDSGNIFIYSPMNTFYNGLHVGITILPTTGSTYPIRTFILTKNGFMGASTPCITDDKFTPNCLNSSDKDYLIEQIKVACKSCLCGQYIIKD